MITEHAQQDAEVLETLRLGGWRAVAVTAATDLPAAWTAFDGSQAAPLPGAAEVRRGVGGRR